MPIRKQMWFWGAGLAALILILWGLGGVLSPFLAGMAIAYFMDPAADWLEDHGFSRTAATALITLFVIMAVVVGLLIIIPMLIDQARGFISNAPTYVESLKGFIEAVGQRIAPSLFENGASPLTDAIGKVRANAEEWSVNLLKSAWSGGMAIFDTLALLVVTPVVAFYMLLDWDRMVSMIDGWLPREHAPVIRRLAKQIDDVLAGFVRGQLSVCVILGGFYATALTVIGLEFGLVIGAFAGLISFIPFVGSIIGGILSIGLALFQFWGEWWMIGGVALIFAIGQAVEGNYLTPKLVGGHVGLHPVALMFALSAFGSMFGFAGMLIAVPTAAVIGVLARYGLSQYLESKFYSGGPRPPEEPD